MEGEHAIAGGDSAIDGKGFVHDRLPKCIVNRWSFCFQT